MRFKAGARVALTLSIASSACALPAPVRTQIDDDLKHCESLMGGRASPLHAEIFGSARVDGKAYVRFFRERIQKIDGEGRFFASCHGALACTSTDGRMRVSSKYGELKMPPLIRLSLLLHEARHAEGWTHERCPSDGSIPRQTPFQHAELSGTRACDRTERGALGIQFLWLSNIGKHCTSCSDVERREALEHSRFILQLITLPSARDQLLRDSVTKH